MRFWELERGRKSSERPEVFRLLIEGDRDEIFWASNLRLAKTDWRYLLELWRGGLIKVGFLHTSISIYINSNIYQFFIDLIDLLRKGY